MKAILPILIMSLLTASCSKNANSPIPQPRRDQANRIFHSIWNDLDSGRITNDQPIDVVIEKYSPTHITMLDGFTLYTFTKAEAGVIELAVESNRIIRAQACADFLQHDFFVNSNRTQLLEASIQSDWNLRKAMKPQKQVTQQGGPGYPPQGVGSPDP